MEYEINLLKKLVSLNTDSSTKENYEKCAALIASEAKKAGLKARIFRARAPDKKPRPNVLVELNAGAKETLLLVSHFDVVAAGTGWKTNPFSVVRKGSTLHGRGVFDDKGAIAVALGAMRELKKEKLRRNIKLLAACDEEVGGKYGTGFVVDKNWRHAKADFALVLDGRTENVTIGCSGTPRGYITLKGKQGHAGYPFKVPNIIHDALPFLVDLKNYKKIAERQISKFDASPDSPKKKVFGRFSITILQAGNKLNVIPGELKIGFDLRTIPEADMNKEKKRFLSYVKKSMLKHGLKSKEIEWIGEKGYGTDPKSPFLKEVIEIASAVKHKEMKTAAHFGGEDGRHVSRRNIPIAGFGPGGKNAHGSRERITLKEMEVTKEVIKRLCRE